MGEGVRGRCRGRCISLQMVAFGGKLLVASWELRGAGCKSLFFVEGLAR